MNIIPEQFQKKHFNFVLVGKQSKKPFQNNWQKKEIKYNNKELQEHLNKKGNVGIRCGGENNLLVVDFDEEEYEKKLLKKLPSTLTIQTGSGGKHCYFYSDKSSSYKILTEDKKTLADVQGEGKQALIPPSIHPNGNNYKIIKDKRIEYISYGRLKALLETNNPDSKQMDEEKIRDDNKNYEKRDDFVSVIKKYVMVKDVLQHLGASVSKNPTDCPLHYSKGKQCLGYTKNIWHCFHCEEKGDIFTLLMLSKNLEFKEAIQYFVDNFGLQDKYMNYLKENKNNNTKEDDEVNLTEVRKQVMREYRVKTVYTSNNKKMYFFKDGKWCKNAKRILEPRVEEILNQKCTNHKVKEIIGKIQRRTEISKEKFNETPEGKVLLKNGVLDLKEKKLEEFNPDYYFKKRVPINYNPTAECPKIMKFLKETFYDKHLPLIQEWLGFQLYNKYLYKKAVIIYGPTDTGKTVFLNLLSRFIGEENKCGVSLQEISRGKTFDLTRLHNSLCNIYDDLSETDLRNTGGFKMAVGDGIITAEYKYGERFQFRNFAKHTFTCNKIPGNEERDDLAYYGRWIPIPLDQQVPEDEQDPLLISKLTTDEGLSGLLNWCLEGLQRLLGCNEFSFSKSKEEVKMTMQREATPLVAFVHDCLFEEQGYRISKEKLYSFYKKYCDEHENSTVSKRKLTNFLKSSLSYIVDTHSGSTRQWLNLGVSFNQIEWDDWDDFNLTIARAREATSTTSKDSSIYSNDIVNKRPNRPLFIKDGTKPFKKDECMKCGMEFDEDLLKELVVDSEKYVFCEDCYEYVEKVKKNRRENEES